MFRETLIFTVLCIASVLVTVKGQPGKMRILPGLTFYHTDDTMTQSLKQEDKDLLNSVMGIISRPEMQKVLEDLQSTLQTQNSGGESGGGNGYEDGGDPYMDNNKDPIDQYGSTSGGHAMNSHIGGNVPIATINVYPGYSGAPARIAEGRRGYGTRSVDGIQQTDAEGTVYGDNSNNDPSDSDYGMARKYYGADSVNDIKELTQVLHGEGPYSSNYPMTHDNYYDANSNRHHLLPALNRRSLSKMDHKDMFTSTQIADILGQRRLMFGEPYDKPSAANHYNSFLYPAH